MAYQAKESDILPTVQDFETLCRYIDTERPTLTGTGDLSTKACFALNTLLSHPRADAQPRNRMGQYPTVHLYFHIALMSGLLTTYAEKGCKTAVALSESYQDFEKLSLSGKYLFIILAWMHHMNVEELYARDLYFSFHGDFVFDDVMAEMGRQTEDAWICREEDYSKLSRLDTPLQVAMYREYFFLCHARSFGWVEFDGARVDEDGRGSRHITVEKLRITPWGASLCGACDTRKFSWVNKRTQDTILLGIEEDDDSEQEIYENDFSENPPGSDGFLTPFLPCFPEGEIDGATLNSLLFPPLEKISDTSVYEFKVQLGRGCYRVIACAGRHTFEELHLAIQEAFEFDNDHLYSFFMDGKRWSRNEINHPYSDEPPFADEVLIAQAGLRQQQTILYLFDYGDSWEFKVTLTSIHEADVPLKRPAILKTVGEAPEQYPDWDEEYEDDDEEE